VLRTAIALSFGRGHASVCKDDEVWRQLSPNALVRETRAGVVLVGHRVS
jgi:hypothetical protein